MLLRRREIDVRRTHILIVAEAEIKLQYFR
jgi:hypothetical protein